jgi:hypothetical protein
VAALVDCDRAVAAPRGATVDAPAPSGGEAVITPEDAQFHDGPLDDHTWAETNYFGLFIPEVPCNIGVYALFRSNLGIVNTTISVNSRMVRAPWEADYWDSQVHVPIPPERDLTDYTLTTGLSVKMHEPNHRWDVRFDDGEQLRLAFRYTAIMPAFDIHDPDQDPMVAAQSEGSDFAWGTAYNGHFDQSGHYEGELELRGRRYAIDCVSTMDHSWGPRPERASNTMSWLHAHVDRDLAIHGIFAFDPGTIDGPSQLKLTHGYVADHGEIVGLKAGEGTSVREGLYPMSTELEVVDAQDRTWHLQGRAQTAFPWQCWPDMVGFNVLHRWQVDGRDAWGEVMDFHPMQIVPPMYSDMGG